jgi:hypothetical protein
MREECSGAITFVISFKKEAGGWKFISGHRLKRRGRQGTEYYILFLFARALRLARMGNIC